MNDRSAESLKIANRTHTITVDWPSNNDTQREERADIIGYARKRQQGIASCHTCDSSIYTKSMGGSYGFMCAGDRVVRSTSKICSDYGKNYTFNK